MSQVYVIAFLPEFPVQATEHIRLIIHDKRVFLHRVFVLLRELKCLKFDKVLNMQKCDFLLTLSTLLTRWYALFLYICERQQAHEPPFNLFGFFPVVLRSLVKTFSLTLNPWLNALSLRKR